MHLSVFVWLTPLNMIISRSIHVALFHFLWMSNSLLCVHTHTHTHTHTSHHIFFIHSSVHGHLGCFHVLTIVYSAAMNTGVHISFWIRVVSRYMPRSGAADGEVTSFSLLRKSPYCLGLVYTHCYCCCCC